MANTEILEKILGNDLCAKWINLRDYAFDKLSANLDIKAIMDTSDKKIVAGVPKLSSNTGTNGEASADHVSSSSYDAWKVFDDDVSTFWMTGSSSAPHWIQYKFNDPVCVKRVYFKESSGYSSRTFTDWTYKIQGSNDGTNWTDLTETLTAVAQTAINIGITIFLENNNNYLYYRYYALVNNRENTSFQLCSLQFYIERTSTKYGLGEWVCEGQVPVMTSNTAPYGEVIKSTIYGSGYDSFRAFDGDKTTGWIANTGSNQYIGYRFLSPVAVTKFRIYCINNGYYGSGQYTYKDAKFQASNDGTNWVDLYTWTNTEKLQDATFEVPKENVGNYIYYRVFIINNYGGGETGGFSILQFYAYQPKGNVPIMTSNTAPYGKVITTGDPDGGSYPATRYKIFDGDLSTESYFLSDNNFFVYKFVNPVCVRKIKFYHKQYNVQGGCNHYKILGSNDGTNWTEIADIDNENFGVAGTFWVEEDLNNDDYYLYYKVNFIKTINPGYGNMHIMFFQFYGREMKVSVPAMTSNTAPWGEAIDSSSYSSYEPYRVFDKVANTYWNSHDLGVNTHLGFKFEKAVCIKFIDYHNAPYSLDTRFHLSAFDFKGSNDGINWETLESYTITDPNTINKEEAFIVDHNDSYKYYALFRTSGGNEHQVQVGELNFFGFDYSERDWDTEHPMRYLYDHGVELEDVDYGLTHSDAYFNKNESDMYVYLPGAARRIYSIDKIDFTDYDFIKTVIKSSVNHTKAAIMVSDTYTNSNPPGLRFFDTANLPYNSYLEIQNINGYYYFEIGVGYSTTVSFYLEELWLGKI